MKKHLKRFLSMMMAVLLCFGIVPSNAFAAEYDYDGYISMIDYNGRGYSLSSSLPAPFGGYSTDKFTELRINDLTAFRTAYCIQLGVATHTGIGYDQSDDYAALTTEQKAMINTALTLGYNVETGTKYGGSAMDEYIATQILIWLIAHGQLGTGYENQIVNEITANSPAAKTIFQKLRENVVTYHTIPSFATENPSAVGAYTHDLKYNEDTGKNETTLVDENNVLKDFSVSYPGVDFSISGNKLHVSTDKKEFGTITAEKELPSSIPGVVTGGTKYWLRNEYQNVVTFDVKGSAEPVKCYFSLEIKAGTLQLVKTSEDGEVSGIPFHISGNGIEKDVVTGPDGTIRVDNIQAGTFRDYIVYLIDLYSKVYEHIKEANLHEKYSDSEVERKILSISQFNRNPFKEKCETEISTGPNLEEIRKSKSFIDKNFLNFDFESALTSYDPPGDPKIKFIFNFTSPKEGASFLERLNGINLSVCKDGKIRKVNLKCEEEQCYCVYNRDIAIHIKNLLEADVQKILENNNMAPLESYEHCFSIQLVKIGKPSHLFTKKEIEDIMRSADDRLSNQLVIDEDGYARIISDNTSGYLYPVRHESWDAGNVYVGKYSKLSTLDDNYISSLVGWLSYLETGRKQYIDYVDATKDEKELIRKINEYY